MDYGAHLPVIDFGFHKFSLDWLSAYVRTARELGCKAISNNDHLIYSRPWLDAPTVRKKGAAYKAAGVPRVLCGR